MTKIRIAVAYHKNGIFADNELFIPVQVGATFAKQELGIQKDSEGDNISCYNPYCCELSATYWLWKNVEADYYGLCHYRRFFSHKEPSLGTSVVPNIVYWCSKVISPFVIDARFTIGKSGGIPQIEESELKGFLNSFSPWLQNHLNNESIDCMCLKKIKMSTYSCKTKLMKAIGLYNYNKLVQIIKEQHSSFYPYFEKTMHDNAYNPCNMLIASKVVFEEYAQLMFPILNEYHQWISLGSEMCINNAALRASGYMGEFITSAFIMQLREQGKTVKEMNEQDIAVASTGLSQTTDSLLSRIKNVLLGNSGGVNLNGCLSIDTECRISSNMPCRAGRRAA